MHWFTGVCIEFTSAKGKMPVPSDPNFIVNAMLNLFECFIKEYRAPPGEDPAVKPPKEIDEIVN